MSCLRMISNMRAQYSSSGLSRVESSPEEGVAATNSRLSGVSRLRLMKSSLTMPRTPWRAPYTERTWAYLRASSATPTTLWLMTAVGPPPCATSIFPGFMAQRVAQPGAHWQFLSRSLRRLLRRRRRGLAGRRRWPGRGRRFGAGADVPVVRGAAGGDFRLMFGGFLLPLLLRFPGVAEIPLVSLLPAGRLRLEQPARRHE